MSFPTQTPLPPHQEQLSWQSAIRALDVHLSAIGYGEGGYGENGYGGTTSDGILRNPEWSTARLRRWVRETFLAS